MTAMPFGKYKGCELERVPTSYLVFVAEQCDNIDPALKCEVRQEIVERFSNPLPVPSVDRRYLVDWCRRASLIAHPDCGGSVRMQQLVNELKDRL